MIMKKLFFIFGLVTSSILFATSPAKKEEVKTTKINFETIKKEEQKIEITLSIGPKITTYYGFIAYDTTCCGTCYRYGVYTEYDYGEGVVLWEFKSVSQMSQSTVITPPCTGAGSYLG